MNVVIGQSQWGFYIYQQDNLFKYLHYDGSWRNGMSQDEDENSAQYIPTQYGVESAINIARSNGHIVVKYEDVEPIPSGSALDNDTRTLKQLAANALMVQNACNLIGVVKSFDRDLRRLKDLLILDGDGVRFHPITIMYVSKIQSMVDCSVTALSAAMDGVENLAEDS